MKWCWWKLSFFLNKNDAFDGFGCFENQISMMIINQHEMYIKILYTMFDNLIIVHNPKLSLYDISINS